MGSEERSSGAGPRTPAGEAKTEPRHRASSGGRGRRERPEMAVGGAEGGQRPGVGGSIPLPRLRSAGRSPLTAPSWCQAVLSPEADTERGSKAWPSEAPVLGEEDRQAGRRVCGSVRASCVRPGALPASPSHPSSASSGKCTRKRKRQGSRGESGCEQGHG